MKIRDATTTDLDALVGLNVEVQRLHVAMRPDVFKSPEQTDMRPGIAWFLTKDHFHAVLAEDERQVVGYAIYEIREQGENTFKFSRRSTYIHQIAVTSACRRKGIGKALLAHIQLESTKLGITRVELDFWSANADARAFYKSAGFVPMREVVEMRG